MRRNSKEKKFLNNLKRGDRIITKSGVHARITEFDSKSNTCIIETMAGKLKIEKLITANNIKLKNFASHHTPAFCVAQLLADLKKL